MTYAALASSNLPTKSAEKDPDPCFATFVPFSQETAYIPIKLSPGKLKKPFEGRAQEAQAASVVRSAPSGGPKKLTWSGRQALAKRQAEEEEQRSKAASWKSPAPTAFSGLFGSRVGSVVIRGAAVGITVSVSASDPEVEAAPPPPACV